MQHWPIETVNLLHQPLEQLIAMFVAIALEQAAGEEGNDGQRNDQRCRHSEDDRPDEAHRKLARALGKEKHGNESEYQHAGGTQNRKADFLGAVDGRLHPFLAHPQMARDVLDDDNRVIDQQPEREDEACDNQLAEVEAHSVNGDKPRCERQRYRDHHDNCCAPAQRQ